MCCSWPFLWAPVLVFSHPLDMLILIFCRCQHIKPKLLIFPPNQLLDLPFVLPLMILSFQMKWTHSLLPPAAFPSSLNTDFVIKSLSPLCPLCPAPSFLLFGHHETPSCFCNKCLNWFPCFLLPPTWICSISPHQMNFPKISFNYGPACLKHPMVSSYCLWDQVHWPHVEAPHNVAFTSIPAFSFISPLCKYKQQTVGCSWTSPHSPTSLLLFTPGILFSVTIHLPLETHLFLRAQPGGFLQKASLQLSTPDEYNLLFWYLFIFFFYVDPILPYIMVIYGPVWFFFLMLSLLRLDQCPSYLCVSNTEPYTYQELKNTYAKKEGINSELMSISLSKEKTGDTHWYNACLFSALVVNLCWVK